MEAPSFLFATAHGLIASGSIVINAAMNGLLSPTTIHWLINGCDRNLSSKTAGATFLPPAVTINSFFRPTIDK